MAQLIYSCVCSVQWCLLSSNPWRFSNVQIWSTENWLSGIRWTVKVYWLTYCHGSPCQKNSVISEFQPGGQWTRKPFVRRLHTQRPQSLHTVYAVSLHFLHLDSCPGELKKIFFLNCGPKEFNLLRSVIDQTSRQFKRCTWFQTEHRKIYQTQFIPVKNRTEVRFMASYCETMSAGQKLQGLVKQS